MFSKNTNVFLILPIFRFFVKILSSPINEKSRDTLSAIKEGSTEHILSGRSSFCNHQKNWIESGPDALLYRHWCLKIFDTFSWHLMVFLILKFIVLKNISEFIKIEAFFFFVYL